MDRRFHVCGVCVSDPWPRHHHAVKSSLHYGIKHRARALLHGLLWGKRIGAWIWMGVVAALAGLYLLTVPSSGLAHLNHGDAIVAAAR